MANITKRNDSYLIRVSCGYNANGKQIVHSMTWKPDKKYTPKQLEKELQRQAALFEEECRQGIALDKVDEIKQFIAIEKNVKGIDASGNAYKICECLSDEISEYVCNILNFFRDIQ